VNTATKPSPGAPGPPVQPARAPHVDREGRFHAHGKISYAVVGVYVFLLLVVLLILPGNSHSSFWWLPYALAALLFALLARYLSTSYRIDDRELRARRILGGRRVRLEDVRAIEFSSLRDLSPVGFFGTWGWRGRMWSPRIGVFDSVQTDPALGLLVTAGDVPLFISPQDPEGFARELSRRVRSYTGRLAVDVGDPLGTRPSSSLDAVRGVG
jgi:hypothetical protein